MRAPVRIISAPCTWPTASKNRARMKNMDDSITHPGQPAVFWTAPGWKSAASTGAALLLALLFVVAGVWKITEPFSAAQRMAQAKVPADLSLLAACMFGVAET